MTSRNTNVRASGGVYPRRSVGRGKPVAAVKNRRGAPGGPHALDYRLPSLWDCWGFQGRQHRAGSEIIVNPREYVAACLQWIDEHTQIDGEYAGRSLSQIRRGSDRPKRGAPHGGDWIARQTLYGMMVRMTTAWDHDGDGRLTSRRYAELGTFLKSVLLLPLLDKMGMTTLYLLPVVKVSNLYRKGELGCPYSARNFLELDAGQHDPLFADDPGAVTEEFAMFVECAHRLGIRLILDLAPRTAARDCDWILEHPEWFYWIDRRSEKGWCSPALPSIHYSNPIPGQLREIYAAKTVREHLAKFRFPPSQTHPRGWARFAAGARRKPPANLMAKIARRFGVVTPPGFSDCINDPQPAWSDVTYLRLYADHPPEAAALLDDPKSQPPYVLFDTIKSNLFPGRRPHRELWDRLAGIIPFYQQFGIDGARVDMAHALPTELERMILQRPRRRDPDFCFVAEDLSHHRTAAARRAGYNLVLGSSWYHQPRAAEGLMHKLLADLPGLKAPILAAAETPDTPRAAVRRGGPMFSRQAVVVNMFLPNAVPMVNSGMEVFERQPMNLGLDVGKPGRFALPKSDPQYGKLAFFDPYMLHWTNRGAAQMVDLIAWASALRRQYIDAITRRSAWFAPRLSANARHILATGFRVRGTYKSLLMLANLDFKTPRRTTITGLHSPREPEVLLELVASQPPALTNRTLKVVLPPGDVKIIRV